MWRARAYLLGVRLALGVCAGLVASPIEAELVLTFESDAPADSFLVTVLSSAAPTTPQQFRLPNQGRASCRGLPATTALTDASMCGRPPACLPPAIYSFWVQGELGGVLSDASNVAHCEALGNCRYACAGVTIPETIQRLLPRPGHPPTVDAEAVRQALDDLARQETPSPPPSVTTVAATVDDVVDQVQTALNALPKAPV